MIDILNVDAKENTHVKKLRYVIDLHTAQATSKEEVFQRVQRSRNMKWKDIKEILVSHGIGYFPHHKWVKGVVKGLITTKFQHGGHRPSAKKKKQDSDDIIDNGESLNTDVPVTRCVFV